VLRANRLAGEMVLSPDITFPFTAAHLREPVRRCRNPRRQAEPPPGAREITTTLDIYTHLFPDDDASTDMAALEAMSQPASVTNVVPIRRPG